MCDDSFSETDAQVVCLQLGYGTSNATARGGGFYGPGRGTIWLDDVACDGSESSLTSCANAGWANVDCGHHKDVGVACSKHSCNVEV